MKALMEFIIFYEFKFMSITFVRPMFLYLFLDGFYFMKSIFILLTGLFETDGVRIPGTECDYQFSRSGNRPTHGRLYSPRYPSIYPNNVRCSYHFHARYVTRWLCETTHDTEITRQKFGGWYFAISIAEVTTLIFGRVISTWCIPTLTVQ